MATTRDIALSTSPRLAPSAYMGPVATGCMWNDSTNAALRQLMVIKGHYARETYSAFNPITVVLQNSQGNELGLGAAANFTFTVAYPTKDTIVGVGKFGGNPTGTAPNNSLLYADPLVPSTTIPRGALCWLRVWGNFPNGVPFITLGNNTELGEGAEFSNTTVTDRTMGGSVSTANASFAPLAILGLTTAPTVAFLGDSRTVGAGDTMDRTGNVGYPRIIGNTNAYISFGVSGSSTAQFLAAHALRDPLINMCSHVFVNYGTNDIHNAVAASTIIANLTAIGNLYPTKPRFISTVGPQCTSSDSFATENNQTTVDSPATLNDLIRGCPAPFSQVIDFADVLESARNSGKWFVNGLGSVAMGAGSRPTTDGVHETRFLLNRLLSKNVFGPSMLTR